MTWTPGPRVPFLSPRLLSLRRFTAERSWFTTLVCGLRWTCGEVTNGTSQCLDFFEASLRELLRDFRYINKLQTNPFWSLALARTMRWDAFGPRISFGDPYFLLLRFLPSAPLLF